ncbi:hypothetical protein GCM10023330_29450 [Litoribaculum gwangyangense]|uniref:Toxin-antitoxin system YwqK family antitoxin n=2 Tax=Litoribaculum gwangyangense TaxID=1130722 RepID=A0ABP9CWN2_9FLAO
MSFGQIKMEEHRNDINYKDVLEINNLIYFKADSILVSGRVVRYNKKNKAKIYILVSKGKPDNLGWVTINDDLVMPKASGLGDVFLAGAFVTDIVMDISGNNMNLPMNQSINQNNINEPINSIQGYSEEQKAYISKEYNNMSVNNEISKHLNLIEDAHNESIEALNKNGSIKNKENFIQENRNGIWKEFYDNNQLKSKGLYIDGLRDGLWKEYYDNGNLESSGEYIKGKKDGLFESYYDEGQLHVKVYYKDGKENGEMLVYHKNGKRKIRGFLNEAKEIGEWKFYDENGELINTEIFEN